MKWYRRCSRLVPPLSNCYLDLTLGDARINRRALASGDTHIDRHALVPSDARVGRYALAPGGARVGRHAPTPGGGLWRDASGCIELRSFPESLVDHACLCVGAGAGIPFADAFW